MRGSWKVREWQKVKERQTPCGTQRLDKATHPKHVGRATKASAGPCVSVPPCVCTAVDTPFLIRPKSNTHNLSDYAHTCGCGALWKLFICTTSPRLLNSTLLSVWTRRMFLPLGESQNWENNKGLRCVFLSGCEEFWVLITQRVLCAAEPHSASIWWTSSIETLHADCLN